MKGIHNLTEEQRLRDAVGIIFYKSTKIWKEFTTNSLACCVLSQLESYFINLQKFERNSQQQLSEEEASKVGIIFYKSTKIWKEFTTSAWNCTFAILLESYFINLQKFERNSQLRLVSWPPVSCWNHIL